MGNLETENIQYLVLLGLPCSSTPRSLSVAEGHWPRSRRVSLPQPNLRCYQIFISTS